MRLEFKFCVIGEILPNFSRHEILNGLIMGLSRKFILSYLHIEQIPVQRTLIHLCTI